MNKKLKLTPEGFCVFKKDSHLSRWIEEDRRLDARVYLPFLEQYVPVGGTVLDIGASLGDHTVVYAKRVGPTGRVLAFEANPVAAEACAINMRPYPWVGIYHTALGEGERRATLVLDENVGASYLKDDPLGDVRIKSLSLISLQEGWSQHKIDFIKIDAEGWEMQILTGAWSLIKTHRPVLLLEVNRAALARQGADPEHLLKQLGYLGYSANPEDSDQYDMIATPK